MRPYCSLHYAWDEPAQPHRLVLELPGARALGTFNLDQARPGLPCCCCVINSLACCWELAGACRQRPTHRWAGAPCPPPRPSHQCRWAKT